MNDRKRRVVSASSAIHSGLLSADIAQMLRPHMAKPKWANIVGSQVASATQVVAVRNGSTLVVRTKSHVWANELSLLKTDILRRLNNALGGNIITDIWFEIGPLNPVEEEEPDIRPSMDELDGIQLSNDALARIAKASSDIADEEMKEKIQRTLLRARQTDQWKRDRGWIPCSECGALIEPQPQYRNSGKSIQCISCSLKNS